MSEKVPSLLSCLRIPQFEHYMSCRILSREAELIGTCVPSHSHTSGLVISENWKMKVLSQSIQNPEVGNAKPIYHSPWKNKCAGSVFWGEEKSEWMRRVNQALIIYHSSRLKCWSFCSASEWLQRLSKFWLEKGRCTKIRELHAKDMFSQANNHVLSNQTDYAGGVSSWAEACDTNNKLMAGCFPGS